MSLFVLLTRKPDRVRLEAYFKHLMHIAKFFQYTWENRQLPARDGYEPFPLNDQFARSTFEGTLFEKLSASTV